MESTSPNEIGKIQRKDSRTQITDNNNDNDTQRRLETFSSEVTAAPKEVYQNTESIGDGILKDTTDVQSSKTIPKSILRKSTSAPPTPLANFRLSSRARLNKRAKENQLGSFRGLLNKFHSDDRAIKESVQKVTSPEVHQALDFQNRQKALQKIASISSLGQKNLGKKVSFGSASQSSDDNRSNSVGGSAELLFDITEERPSAEFSGSQKLSAELSSSMNSMMLKESAQISENNNKDSQKDPNKDILSVRQNGLRKSTSVPLHLEDALSSRGESIHSQQTSFRNLLRKNRSQFDIGKNSIDYGDGIHERLDSINRRKAFQRTETMRKKASTLGLGRESEAINFGLESTLATDITKEDDVENGHQSSSFNPDTSQSKASQKRAFCFNRSCRLSIPFSLALTIIYSLLIASTGLFTHFQWEYVMKKAIEESTTASKTHFNEVTQDLIEELTEKIGIQASAIFSAHEQTFHQFVKLVRDDMYDPVKDRYKLINDLVRTKKSISYAGVAFENGYYLASGQFSLTKTNDSVKSSETYAELSHDMRWLNLYNQPIFECPDGATQVKLDDGDWISYFNENGKKDRYVLAKNIHSTQALVEPDGSLPSEILVNETIQCADENGSIIDFVEGRKNYSGWFQDIVDVDDSVIDASDNAGVGYDAFAIAELWGVDEPPDHFVNKTFETYNFLEPIWPDNNINGNHTRITFQNSSGMPLYGITRKNISNIMYRTLFDTRKRQWYQSAKSLYNKHPVSSKGSSDYHKSIISWFPLYLWQGETPDLSIGLTTPLYGPQNEFAGVMSIDISIKTISRFLKSQKFGKKGVGFAVRPKDYVHSHGGVGVDEYVNMTYNNHEGSLLGVSKGSDYGIACGNDYTNNTELDQHGPHYFLDETEWFNSETREIRDHTNLTEMILPIAIYKKGGWICRLKIAKAINASISNRALPAENHEDPFIASSTQHIRNYYGSFEKLTANAASGNTKYEYLNKTMILQWIHVKDLKFPGFRPLILLVIPEEDYLSDILEERAEIRDRIDRNVRVTGSWILFLIILTLCLSIGIALFITFPLKRLNKEFLKLSKLEFYEDEGQLEMNMDSEEEMTAEDEASIIREIAGIQHSFKGMKMGLSSFSKFVPFSVVKRIVGGDVSATSLGVKKREVTVLFADIAGFTSFVESNSLETVMHVLEEYLTAMVAVVEGNGGTIGDFIGDCIMAFWNSPLDQPDHAQLAVDTVFAMEERLEDWNKIWESQGLPRMRIRIGIATGEVLAGNIGSPIKMKFGVVGDTVNLASRVENLNKYYGTAHLITDSTYEAISHTTICRLADKVAVKGRSTETYLYEPLAPKDAEDAEELKNIADETARILSALWSQDFEKAINLADVFLSRYPDDTVVSGIKEKSRNFLLEPPAKDWDGVNRMNEK